MLPRGSSRPVPTSAFYKRPPIKIPGAKCKSLAKPYPWIPGGYGSQPSVRDRSQRRLRRGSQRSTSARSQPSARSRADVQPSARGRSVSTESLLSDPWGEDWCREHVYLAEACRVAHEALREQKRAEKKYHGSVCLAMMRVSTKGKKKKRKKKEERGEPLRSAHRSQMLPNAGCLSEWHDACREETLLQAVRADQIFRSQLASS